MPSNSKTQRKINISSGMKKLFIGKSFQQKKEELKATKAQRKEKEANIFKAVIKVDTFGEKCRAFFPARLAVESVLANAEMRNCFLAYLQKDLITVSWWPTCIEFWVEAKRVVDSSDKNIKTRFVSLYLKYASISSDYTDIPFTDMISYQLTEEYSTVLLNLHSGDTTVSGEDSSHANAGRAFSFATEDGTVRVGGYDMTCDGIRLVVGAAMDEVMDKLSGAPYEMFSASKHFRMWRSAQCARDSALFNQQALDAAEGDGSLRNCTNLEAASVKVFNSMHLSEALKLDQFSGQWLVNLMCGAESSNLSVAVHGRKSDKFPYIYCNEAHALLCGVPRSELMGQPHYSQFATYLWCLGKGSSEVPWEMSQLYTTGGMNVLSVSDTRGRTDVPTTGSHAEGTMASNLASPVASGSGRSGSSSPRGPLKSPTATINCSSRSNNNSTYNQTSVSGQLDATGHYESLFTMSKLGPAASAVPFLARLYDDLDMGQIGSFVTEVGLMRRKGMASAVMPVAPSDSKQTEAPYHVAVHCEVSLTCPSYRASRQHQLRAILREVPTQDVPSFTITVVDSVKDGSFRNHDVLQDTMDFVEKRREELKLTEEEEEDSSISNPISQSRPRAPVSVAERITSLMRRWQSRATGQVSPGDTTDKEGLTPAQLKEFESNLNDDC